MTEPSHAAPEAATLLISLLGTWHLHRSIPGHAEAIGTATLTALQDLRPDLRPHLPPALPGQLTTALYQERVILRTTAPGTALTATQQYLFSALTGPILRIDQLPGPRSPHLEPFHTLHLTPTPHGTLTAHSTHTSHPDLYRSTYTFGPGPRWHTLHHVTGPRKLYQATTLYTRHSA